MINKSVAYWALIQYDTKMPVNPPIVLALFEKLDNANKAKTEIENKHSQHMNGIMWTIDSALFSKYE